MSAKKSAAKDTAKAKKSTEKKAATKKAVSKKNAAKSVASSEKNPSKVASPQQPRETARKATKKAGELPATGGETSAKSTSGETRVRKAASLHRDRHHTPPIFKLPSRRHAPIVFTLDDVREHLAKRKQEEAKVAAEARKEESTSSAPNNIAVAANAVANNNQHTSGKRTAASLEDILGLTSAKGARNSEIPEKWKHYHNLLRELRESVKMGLMKHSSDTLKRSQKEDTGDISTSADAGTDTFDRDFALSLLSSEQEALKEIEAAIRRIETGNYGICEITGETIAPERLEAVPFTRFSLEGQRQHEATARRRSNRGGAVYAESSADISFGDDDGDN